MNWDYIAGFIDGEGHIGVCETKKGQRLSISVTNTHITTISLMKEFFDHAGLKCGIYIRQRRDNYKEIATLAITGHESQRNFLLQIESRCFVKKNDIDRALKFIAAKSWQTPHKAEAINTALMAYQNGASLREIERTHGISSRALRQHAQRVGIPMRDRKTAIRRYFAVRNSK